MPALLGATACYDHVGRGRAGRAGLKHRRNPPHTRAFHHSSSRRTGSSASRVPSGRALLSTFTTVAPDQAEDLAAQRARPHRGHVGNQQVRTTGPGRRRRTPGAARWAQRRTPRRAPRRGQVQQPGTPGDLVGGSGCGPAFDGGPGVVGTDLAFQQGWYVVDVTGPRQRDGSPNRRWVRSNLLAPPAETRPPRDNPSCAARPVSSAAASNSVPDPVAEVGGRPPPPGKYRGAGEVGGARRAGR